MARINKKNGIFFPMLNIGIVISEILHNSRVIFNDILRTSGIQSVRRMLIDYSFVIGKAVLFGLSNGRSQN